MSIVSLPLTNQLTNGGTADGGQVLADLNAIASQVNANAAKNGVNGDITSLTALVSIPSNVTATGWTLNTPTITTPAITGGTMSGTAITSTNASLTTPTLTGGSLTGVSVDATSTGVTQTAGTSNTTLATTQFVGQAAFNASLPAQATHADNVTTTDGTNASWTTRLKATVMGWKDGADATKQMLWNLAGITTGNTRTLNVPDKSGTLAMTSDLVLTVGFNSAAQTITSAGSLTIAHGLGSIPKIVLGYLTCTIAEQGYLIGDVLCVPLGQADVATANSYGVSVVPDATNLNVRYGIGAFSILNKTTGNSAVITAANWTFSLRAFA